MRLMKKTLSAIIVFLMVVLLSDTDAYAATSCSMSHRVGHFYGGVDYYFNWVIEPGERIISSGGYGCPFGIGNCSGSVNYAPYSVSSTHFYITVTSGIIDLLSFNIKDMISLEFPSITLYSRDEVALWMYTGGYEIMHLE